MKTEEIYKHGAADDPSLIIQAHTLINPGHFPVRNCSSWILLGGRSSFMRVDIFISWRYFRCQEDHGAKWEHFENSPHRDINSRVCQLLEQ